MTKKIKIKIVSWLNGSVLFEYKCADNTIKKTVEEAVRNNANLSSANLSSANLSSANLYSADLSSADLSSADLSFADLYSADLRSANLSSADLSFANLRSANLRSADLSSANLYSADLRSADLSSANLRSANLYSADLRSANLSSADLRSANLSSADLSSAKNAKPYLIGDNLSILEHQKNALIAYKYLDKDMQSPIQDVKLKYKVGEVIEEKNCNYDKRDDCGAGLNVATIEWCLRNTGGNIDDYKYIEVIFEPKDIVAIPYTTDGKFRVKKLTVSRIITKKELKKSITPIKEA